MEGMGNGGEEKGPVLLPQDLSFMDVPYSVPSSYLLGNPALDLILSICPCSSGEPSDAGNVWWLHSLQVSTFPTLELAFLLYNQREETLCNTVRKGPIFPTT